jgi:hypothetical protein
MEHAEGLRLDKVRCAEVHAAQEADPAGSAPHWDAVLAVEIPGPWPREISEAEPFASLAGAPAATLRGPDGRTWRPQALSCDSEPEFVRVIAFERTTGAAGPFARREWVLPSADPAAVADLLRSLVDADPERLARHDRWRDDPDDATADLLLCTHGTRDVCCGGLGTDLYGEVVGALGGRDTTDGHRRRIWRTSHTGGHRFAPTALSFPEGVAWAHLGVAQCRSIVERAGDPADLGAHMRGALGVEGAVAQVADREGFAAFGWDWLASERKPVLVAHDRSTLDSTVEVMAAPHLGQGMAGTVSARVALDRHVPMPSCGATVEADFSTEPVWKVTHTDATPYQEAAGNLHGHQ